MIKKLFLFILASSFSISSYSQDFYKINKITSVIYRNEKWEMSDSQVPSENSYLMFDGNKIKIAGTKYEYICIGEWKLTEKNECLIYYWDGFDYEGDKCFIIFMKCYDSDGGRFSSLSIGYKDRNEAIKFDLNPEHEK